MPPPPSMHRKLTSRELSALLSLGRISAGENVFLNVIDADSLVALGLAERFGKGQYTLTEEGLHQLALLPGGEFKGMDMKSGNDSDIWLAYRDGTRAETLRASGFTIDAGMSRVTVDCDFLSVLQPWNRSLLSFADAKEFITRHPELESLHVLGPQVVSLLKAAPQAAQWRLNINCGEPGIFSYAVKPAYEADKAVLGVQSVLKQG